MNLSRSQKSSIICFIDTYIRKYFGMIKQPYNLNLNSFMIDLRKYYERYDDGHELLQYWDDPAFYDYVKNKIETMLNDRCTLKEYQHYQLLCREYGLVDKGMMNRQKLSKRIQAILDSEGNNQDI